MILTDARWEAYTARIARGAWRGSGIWPRNSHIVLLKLPSSAQDAAEELKTPSPPPDSDIRTPRADKEVERVFRDADISKRSPWTARRIVQLGRGVKRATASLAEAQTALTLANKRIQELTDAVKEPRKARRVDTSKGKIFTPDEADKVRAQDRAREEEDRERRWKEARAGRFEELKREGEMKAARV